jgi:hypothetical protein
MDDDLTAIVAADEEARARVHAARTAAAGRVDEARRDIERARSQRLETLRTQAARDVQAIAEQTARTTAEREAARSRSIEVRHASSEACLEAAAELYARIVIDGPPGRESK